MIECEWQKLHGCMININACFHNFLAKKHQLVYSIWLQASLIVCNYVTSHAEYAFQTYAISTDAKIFLGYYNDSIESFDLSCFYHISGHPSMSNLGDFKYRSSSFLAQVRRETVVIRKRHNIMLRWNLFCSCLRLYWRVTPNAKQLIDQVCEDKNARATPTNHAHSVTSTRVWPLLQIQPEFAPFVREKERAVIH